MSISSVARAPVGSYSEDDNCAICLVPLNRLLENRLGDIVIHKNSNGAKHPMHAECLKKTLASNHRFDGSGSCPICRDRISWPKPKDSLIERITGVSTLIIITGAAHATFSYLTGWPLLGAIVPGVCSSLMSIDSLWVEHKELGLQRSLGVEIGIKLATSAAVIGIPLLASITASQITESIIPNSLITATLGVGGLIIPFGMKCLDGTFLPE